MVSIKNQLRNAFKGMNAEQVIATVKALGLNTSELEAMNTMGDGVDKIIEIAIVTIIASSIEVVAIGNLINASVSGWPLMYTSMWAMVGIFSILATVLVLVAIVRQRA